MKRRCSFLALAGLLAGLVFGPPWPLQGKAPVLTEVREYVSARDRELMDRPTPQDKWTFSADRVVGQHDSEYAEAWGNATLTNGRDTLRADFMRYYRATGWVVLKGEVRARWQGDFLEAGEAEFDLNSKRGWLKNGSVFVSEPHLFIQSEYIEKRSGDTYKFKNAKVTACSGERPAWSFTAGEGDIVLDGYARLYHTAFRIKDVPVLYSPYLRIPVGGKRQSGFLLPSISSSKRLGLGLNLPYYWAIDSERDATFYENWMSKRGFMQGFEFRHAEDTSSKGLWRLDWMKDSEYADTEAEEDSQFRGDGLIRPNRDRWWWRSKYEGFLGSPRLRILADIDLVSDQNYLREFRYGLNGYEQSREQFLKEFGRDIDPMDSTTRKSTVLLSRDFDQYGLAGRLDYTQNLAFWNRNAPAKDDTTVQKLPELDFYAFKDRLADTPLEYEASAKYDYFWRQRGTKAHRLELEPSISLPLASKWITFIPKVGLRHEQYLVSEYENIGNQTLPGGAVEGNRTTTNDTPSATVFDLGFSLFSELSRVYDLADGVRLAATKENAGQSRWSKLRHSVTPRVEYAYTPVLTGQDKRPYFDERDRISGKNEVKYSLTNVLDRRREMVSLAPAQDGSVRPQLASDYLDFLTFRLEQSYDRNEATRNEQVLQYERRPFSDLLAEVVVKPERYLSLTSRTWFSPYLHRITEHEHMVSFGKQGLGDIYFGYDFLESIDEYKRQRPDRMKILRLGGGLQLTDSLYLSADYRTDLDAGRDIEKTLGLTWRSECYDVQFLYSRTASDDRFDVRFNLFEW
ncbi:MAG: LPS assembly protein LptD [Desulfovibrionaceae bacterium]|nr:LPS assembly protein LptD [Desulfovibrionaceae bacterium]